jgi:pyrroline-5-carboxylate reductase
VVVSDPTSAIATTKNNREAAAQDIVFLAVHPPVMGAVLAEIAPALKPGAAVVSLAPKFTIAKISAALGGFARIARMIPNAPSLIGAGYNPVAFAAGMEREELLALFAPFGECPVVAEDKLEAFAILTGMGPTYFWFQLQALREIAGQCGLSEADIAPALKRTVCGAARTLLESGLSPAEVMDLIPVKPLGEDEPAIKTLYQTKLPALYARIKP